MTLANALFTMKNWDETPYGIADDGPKIAHAHSTNTYTGDITGNRRPIM